MAKAKKEKVSALSQQIITMQEEMIALLGELEKAENVAAAARRARKLTSSLTKVFKEFRKESVAHHKK